MINLEPDECRIVGVLVEKALTTPGQYPMTINAIMVGSSQKSNRYPVETFDEERVIDALNSLRAKQLIIETHLEGSRVPKFRHNAREELDVGTRQLIVLTELLLRGPQSVGELRTRASRMRPLETLEVVESALSDLMAHDPPYVRELPPEPGSRAKRFVQLLCPDLHPVTTHTAVHSGAEQAGGLRTTAGAPRADISSATVDAMTQRLDRLEDELSHLKDVVTKLAEALGETHLLEDQKVSS